MEDGFVGMVRHRAVAWWWAVICIDCSRRLRKRCATDNKTRAHTQKERETKQAIDR